MSQVVTNYQPLTKNVTVFEDAKRIALLENVLLATDVLAISLYSSKLNRRYLPKYFEEQEHLRGSSLSLEKSLEGRQGILHSYTGMMHPASKLLTMLDFVQKKIHPQQQEEETLDVITIGPTYKTLCEIREDSAHIFHRQGRKWYNVCMSKREAFGNKVGELSAEFLYSLRIPKDKSVLVLLDQSNKNGFIKKYVEKEMQL